MIYLKTIQWKKNRKFGDIHGGRSNLKLSDNIFSRLHNLKPLSELDEVPVLLEDNPSRDFFFPLSAQETKIALQALPKRDYCQITHLWLRRVKTSEYNTGERNLAEFICGRGVRLITLYAWPKDMTIRWRRKPSNRIVNDYGRFGVEVKRKGNIWFAKPSLLQLRKFYIEYLLYHEVGHHVDWYYRHWSKANAKITEDYADQFALQLTTTASRVLNKLEKLNPS